MTNSRSPLRIALFVGIVIQTVLMMVPLFYMLSTSFKAQNEVFTLPIQWIPSQFLIENYTQPLQEKPFLRWFFNSTFVATASTALVVLTSSLAGYSFAKFRYPGRNLLFWIIIATLRRNVGDFQAGIADELGEEQPGFRPDGGAEGFGVARINQRGLDAEARQGVGKEIE